MKKKSKILLFLLTLILMNHHVYALEYIKSSNAVCTLTDEYKTWISKPLSERKLLAEPTKCQEFYSLNTSIEKSEGAIGDASASKFNLVDLGYTSDVFTGKNQNMCWAFAAIDTVESSYRVANNGKSLSLSELHLGLNTLSFSGKNQYGYNGRNSVGVGGNFILSSNYLSKRLGPVLASNLALDADRTLENALIKNDYSVESIDMIESNSCFTQNDAINKIKELLVNYGAVVGSYMDDSNYYNKSTSAYYYNGDSSVNHAVSIVGWDDNYSASNFKNTPAGDGAWIIQDNRSSYGGSGDVPTGYFYISYYDTNICKRNMSVHDVTTNVSDNSYSYTYTAEPNIISISNTTLYLKNKFTKGSTAEILDSVSFGTIEKNEIHELYYSLDGTMTNAKLLGSVTAWGYGYRSVNPKESITITDDTFYIIDKVTKSTSSTTNKYFTSITYSDSSSPYYESSKKTGVSYYSFDGESWLDSIDSSNGLNTKFYASISAFTSDLVGNIVVSNPTQNPSVVTEKEGYYVFPLTLTDINISDVTVKIYSDDDNNTSNTENFKITKDSSNVKIEVISGKTQPGNYIVEFSSKGIKTTSKFSIAKYESEIQSITIKGGNEVAVGGTLELTAVVNPTDATNQTLTWTSSNQKVATVENGIIKGISAGNATITVQSTTNNAKSEYKISVIDTKSEEKNETDQNITTNPQTGIKKEALIFLICIISITLFLIIFEKNKNILKNKYQ